MRHDSEKDGGNGPDLGLAAAIGTVGGLLIAVTEASPPGTPGLATQTRLVLIFLGVAFNVPLLFAVAIYLWRNRGGIPDAIGRLPRVVWARIRNLRKRVKVTVLTMALVLIAGAFIALRGWDSPCAPPTELRVLTTPESRAAITAAAARFEEYQAGINPCRTVHVSVYATEFSGRARDALTSGWREDYLRMIGPRPDIWIPGSTAEVSLVQSAQTTGAPRVGLESLDSVMSTPLVVGVPTSAEASTSDEVPTSGEVPPSDEVPTSGELGSDRAVPPWRDILDTADAAGIDLVRPSPASSTTGLLHTLALYQTEGGTSATNTDLHALEQSVTHPDYPLGETRALLCHHRRVDARRVAPLVMEKVLSDYNAGHPLGGECGVASPPDHRLIAYYPADTAHLDFPFVRLDWREIDKASGLRTGNGAPQAEMARQFHDWLLKDGRSDLLMAGFRDPWGGGTAGGPLADDPGIVLDVPYRAVSLAAPTLTATLRQAEEARTPSRVLLALDASKSMNEDLPEGLTRFQGAGITVQTALDLLGGNDQVGLWTFPATGAAGDVGRRDIVPIGAIATARNGGTRDHRVIDAIDGLSPYGQSTPLYNTIAAGLEHLDTARKDDPTEVGEALVIITDGIDDVDGLTLLQLHKRLDRPRSPAAKVFLLTIGETGCETKELRVLGGVPDVDCLEVDLSRIERVVQRLLAQLWGG